MNVAKVRDIVNHCAGLLYSLHHIPTPGDRFDEKTWAPELPCFNYSIMGHRNDSEHAPCNN